jgi:hypothetical protein
MKLIAILLLAASFAAAQDEKPFKGTISGMGDPEPPAYVPDPNLPYAGPTIITPLLPAPGVVVLFAAVPVVADAGVIGGVGYLPRVAAPVRHVGAPVHAVIAAHRR